MYLFMSQSTVWNRVPKIVKATRICICSVLIWHMVKKQSMMIGKTKNEADCKECAEKINSGQNTDSEIEKAGLNIPRDITEAKAICDGMQDNYCESPVKE